MTLRTTFNHTDIDDRMSFRTGLLKSVDISASHIPWWEWDYRRNIVTTNDLKATMLGYDPERFRGKGYQVWTDIVHPDDYGSSMEAMRDLLSGRKEIYQSDYRIRAADGSYHWYMDRGFVVEHEEGTIARIRGLVLDLGREIEHGGDVEAVVALLRTTNATASIVITICSVCQRIKTGAGQWVVMTPEFSAMIVDTLSHGMCPDCVRRMYPDLADRILSKV